MVQTKGLEGIRAGESAICLVDGLAGRLSYRGYDIADLAAESTFEETTYLLWHEKLPTRAELEAFKQELTSYRTIPDVVLGIVRDLSKVAQPMDVLRTAVSALSAFDRTPDDQSREANQRRSLQLLVQTAAIVAAIERCRNGQPIVPPEATMSHAANFLHRLTGNVPDAAAEKAMDVALILHAEHSFNASTFAARVTASTMSDVYSCITTAIGVLKGPLHGGANTAVMKTLQEIGDESKVDSWVRSALAQKKRIMGFGHRVYKTTDPRAVVLKRLAKEMGERTAQPHWYRMTEKMEEIMMTEKKLPANVDCYSASLYFVLGIPPDLYTPIFAVSRVAGWTAHVLEQLADNRLIRPDCEYTGPTGLRYMPLADRA